MSQTHDILKFVEDSEKPVTIDEIVEKFPHIMRHTIRGRLSDAVRGGRLVKRGRNPRNPKFAKNPNVTVVESAPQPTKFPKFGAK